MAKSDITIEVAQGLIDKVAQELGLLVTPTTGFIKVQGPTNKHRIYVQRARTLGRIDTTLPNTNADGTPVQGTRGLNAPNGSVTCHIEPTLEWLEFHLRRLGDGSLGTQVPNKPRPFAATKQPARKPKAVAAPIPTEAVEPIPEGGSLKDRLKVIHSRVREAKINMILENPEKYGLVTRDEAAAIVDKKVEPSEFKEVSDNAERAELNEVLAETGIEVVS
jgi:hypothetical protein